MKSFFNEREDSSDNTLSRLSSQWSGKASKKNSFQTELKFKEREVDENKVQFTVGDQREDAAHHTLDRLTSQWSENKKTPSLDNSNQNSENQNLKLSSIETVDDGVTLHHIDEESAPSLLIDWKLWGIKLAVFVVLPLSIVLSGGARQIWQMSPALGEFCHSQTLTMQEFVLGKDAIEVADNHFELAELYFNQKRYGNAMDHAHAAAQIYSFNCLDKMAQIQTKNRTLAWSSTSAQIPVDYKVMGTPMVKLRQSLVLAARSAKEGNYDNLANKYFSLALTLEPQKSDFKGNPIELLKLRVMAAESFASKKHYLEADRAYSEAFRLLSLYDLKGLYLHSGSTVSEPTLEQFRYLIYLHEKRAQLYLQAGSPEAVQEQELVKNLQKHLLYLVARNSLYQKWKPHNPYMQPVHIRFHVDGTNVSRVDASSLVNYSDNDYVKWYVLKNLTGSEALLKNDTKFSALFDQKIEPADLSFKFSTQKISIDEPIYLEAKSSPIFTQTDLFRMEPRKSYNQAIVDISQQL